MPRASLVPVLLTGSLLAKATSGVQKESEADSNLEKTWLQMRSRGFLVFLVAGLPW